MAKKLPKETRIEIAKAFKRIRPEVKTDEEAYAIMKVHFPNVGRTSFHKFKSFPIPKETQNIGISQQVPTITNQIEDFANAQKDLPNDIKQIISDNFWEMYDRFELDDEVFDNQSAVNPSGVTGFVGKEPFNLSEKVVSFPESKPFLKQESEPIQETSSDYEIKPSIVRDFRKFDETEHYQLSKAERWLILPDTQIPYCDSRSMDAVLKYASENYWDGVIQLGDFMDWDFISRWTKENARKIEGQRFLEEYIHGNAVLDQIQSAVRNQNKDAHFIILEGNHDWRIENVINQTPSLEGMIEMEKHLRLEERGITYWRYWCHRKPFVIGKAWFIHGEYIGTHHAKKTAESYHRNVFYGHTHDVMSYTKTTAWGDSIMCSSLGTLSIMDLEYMGHRPSNWQQAFAEFFFQPNGCFNHYVTNIYNHQFVAINGRKYQG